MKTVLPDSMPKTTPAGSEGSQRPLQARPRRLRRTAAIRNLVAEGRLTLDQLVQGHFVMPGSSVDEPVSTLPGVRRTSVDRLIKAVEKDFENGVRSVMLFGLSEQKDSEATEAYDHQNAACQGVAALKEAFGDELVVMADVCLCAYTSHGHCGLVEGGRVDNDTSLPVLARMGVELARAGADFVCPSDMMDGRVGAIRDALDAEGFPDTAILAYTAKYASAFYGPFRDAAGSAPGFGDRRSYQMDTRNRREALRELELDLAEGADIVMVKPAMAFLDVISDFAQYSNVPVAAYNVRGEYAMVKMAAEHGMADERELAMEVLGGIRRAGADLIVTYHASQAAEQGWLPR